MKGFLSELLALVSDLDLALNLFPLNTKWPRWGEMQVEKEEEEGYSHLAREIFDDKFLIHIRHS